MGRKNNSAHGVFLHVNMLTGPEYKDPETGVVSRCWPYTLATNNEGRPYYTVAGKKILAYRLVYELVKGVELGNKIFRHKCDNQICCNPDHGIPGSHQENMDDMKSRERHGLPHVTVQAIRKAAAAGVLTHAQIGTAFGVSRQTVGKIVNKDNYEHVKDEE